MNSDSAPPKTLHRHLRCVALFTCLFATACSAPSKVVSADISRVPPITNAKAGTITDPQLLATLESFFPAYRTAKSNMAGGWKTGYDVTFHLSDGSSARVSTSVNDNNTIWSNGHGDFRTHGDFNAFMERFNKP